MFDLDYKIFGPGPTGVQYILNGEVGNYFAHSSRYLYRFREQGLILKVEFGDDSQTQNDLNFINNIVEPDDEQYFVQILGDGMLDEVMDGYPSVYPLCFGDAFLIEPFYDYESPTMTRCEHSIIGNRMANKYNIGDWCLPQWGIVDDIPVIWDIGCESSHPVHPTEARKRAVHCYSCKQDHKESLEW